MPKCSRIKTKHRRVCIGDLDKRIILQNRNLTPPEFGLVDFDEDFQTTLEVWAGIDTVTGKTFFDGVNTDTPITHEIKIVFDSSVTASTWIQYSSRRIDILKVEDLEDRNEFMKLTCVDRGLVSVEASKA